MAYHSLTLRMLISAPGDVPAEDLRVIHATLNGWNVRYGEQMGLSVIPVSWTEHAVAEFGDRPQGLLNKQLVERADLALALFADRLGTPTGTDESGTAEEIREMAEAGKPVSVLRSIRTRAPLKGETAVEEKGRLETYLASLEKQALVLSYATDADLARHVENLLSSQATASREIARGTSSPQTPNESVGVWPSIRTWSVSEEDTKGRLKSRNKAALVLTNKTGRPVRDVSFAIEGNEDQQGFQVINRDAGPVAILPPDGELTYPLIVYGGGGTQAQCTVSWSFEGDEPRQTVATIRP